jgi:excisionase family DNA binding protein
VIAHTIAQAAARVGRSVDTIREWIRDGHLTAVTHPIDGQRYVSEDHLVDVERDMRQRQQATRAVTDPPT